jgi:hypothetical protein
MHRESHENTEGEKDTNIKKTNFHIHRVKE